MCSSDLCCIAQVTSKGLTITDRRLDGVRSEQIDMFVAGEVYRRVEAVLTGKKDAPMCMDDFPTYTDWRDLWHEPLVDCKFAKETGLLKPYDTVVYRALWRLYREGRLHSVLGERNGHPITRFWLD